MKNELELLTKEETKILETTTTPILNIFTFYRKSSLGEELRGKFMGLHCWYINHNIKDNIYLRWKKLAEILNTKPTFYVNYEFKEACWGLKYKNLQFLFYYSKKGLGIQVEKHISGEETKNLIIYLSNLINNGKTDIEIIKESTNVQ